MSFYPQNDRYLFLDMNSFFASCEQQLNPNLREKALVVATYVGKNGCCIAASQKAKEKGIKTGEKIGRLRKIYPHLKIIKSRPAVYRSFQKKIVAAIKNFTPSIMVKSIDEVAFKLSSHERGGGRPQKLALSIKKQLAKKVGKYLTCSIGVGPNIFWAKQAAEERKPNGFTVIRLEQIPNHLRSWKLKDLKGVADRTEKKLKTLKIYSPFDLYKNSPELLRKKLKIEGEYWWLRLHGYDIGGGVPARKRSIARSCVLPPKARNWKTARRVMEKLSQKVAEKLWRENCQSQGVIISVKFLEAPDWRRYLKTPFLADSFKLWSAVKKLWQKAPKDKPPFLIAVAAVNLTKKTGRQLELFDRRLKTPNLQSAISSINNRFGKWTLKPASLLQAEPYAPDHISFGTVDE